MVKNDFENQVNFVCVYFKLNFAKSAILHSNCSYIKAF
jgi:hypothetical protein